MYLYKDNNNWVCGHSITSYIPQGACILKNNDSSDIVSIVPLVENKYINFNNINVLTIKKNADGDLYASQVEFIAATKDFFVNAILPLEARVAELEDGALDVLFIDYWQTNEIPPVSPSEGEIWAQYAPETDPLAITVFYSYVTDEWIEIMGDNSMPISTNKIYINKADNIQYRWNGSIMVPLTFPLSYATKEEAEDGVENTKIMTPLRVKESTATKQTVFTGICQEQYLTENDIEIDTVNLKFKINTVKGGTIITSLNPICFYIDGNGIAAKHTLSTAQEVSFTNTTGIWYFYFNSSGTLIATQSAWTDFSNIAAVYRMYWNATLYRFTVTSANATLGATYTNNGVTYTVLETIAAGTSLKMSGSGLPLSSGTLTRASGTGDATITFSTYTFVDRDVVESVEYHKNDVSWIDHAWKHAQGTVWNNGGEIVSNLISINGSGVPNTSPNADGRNTVVSLTSLSCIDDNLLYTVTNDTANTKFHQDLGNTTAASLTLSNSALFKIRINDSNGLLQFLPATRFPFPWDVATNSPQCITSAGVRTLISDNRWFVTYIYSLQDPRAGEAVKVISEVSEFTSYVNAQASSWEGLKALYPTLRDNEIRPLYRLIFYCDKSGGGSYNAAVKYSALVKIDDIRTFRTSSVSTVSGTVLASSVLVTPPTGIVATNQQSFDVEIADMFYGRNVTLAAYDIDLSIGENFTKVYANGNAFTISNPIVGKRFRLFISGGTVLTTPTFKTPALVDYTTTWIASTLASDYNGTAAVLYAELRSAGALVLFWGE